MTNDDERHQLEADLVAWGRVITLETRGRRSGIARRANVGFIEEADGSMLVAASSDATNWALNLRENPGCVVHREGIPYPSQALPLGIDDHHRAVQALILKYGTPAERLGAGPAFRLVLILEEPGTPH